MELFEKNVLEQIRKKLLRKKHTIAAAESVTSGLLQFALSSMPDAAKFFQGGITAYNLGQKFKHLHVEPLHAQEVNCVSKIVAAEMAIHICQQFSSTWGISITGYATPVPESANKIFAFYAFAFKGKIISSGKFNLSEDDPDTIQITYVNKLLRRLSSLV